MNLCQSHWQKLREAIAARGLEGFVAKDAMEAAKRVAEDGYEPLMGASASIFLNAFREGGLAVMLPGDSGTPPCPICFLSAHCPSCRPCTSYEPWIDRAADDELEVARARGLIVSH